MTNGIEIQALPDAGCTGGIKIRSLPITPKYPGSGTLEDLNPGAIIWMIRQRQATALCYILGMRRGNKQFLPAL